MRNNRNSFRLIPHLTSLVALFFVMSFSSLYAQMSIGTNFWFRTTWSGEQPFKSGVNFSSTSDPWNPVFIDEINFYKCLRFMDWGCTNNSNMSTWSQRRKKTDQNQEASTGGGQGIAYEWMIDLCNKVEADMWVCIPHKADANYVTELAKLIKAQLNPKLKCYIEYSNETWNAGFDQADYCLSESNRLNLISKNDHVKRAYFHAYKAVRIFKSFSQVFGADTTRLVKVLAGWSGNSEVTSALSSAIRDSKVNPDKVTVNALAIAPYFAPNADGNDMNAIKTAVSIMNRYIDIHYAISTRNGWSLVCYEGGQHAGEWKSGGSWGAKQFTGQKMADAPKYRALFDFAKQNPITSTDDAIVENNEVKIYPNPTDGILNFNMEEIEKSTIEIFDATGQKIIEEKGGSPISLESMPKGMYLVKVKSNNGVTAQKVILK